MPLPLWCYPADVHWQVLLFPEARNLLTALFGVGAGLDLLDALTRWWEVARGWLLGLFWPLLRPRTAVAARCCVDCRLTSASADTPCPPAWWLGLGLGCPETRAAHCRWGEASTRRPEKGQPRSPWSLLLHR